MNELKKLTFMDRLKNAAKAFMGKPVGSVTYAFELRKCSDCEFNQNKHVVLYECDLESCGDECPNVMCRLTRDIRHAVNFEPEVAMGDVTYYVEKSRQKPEVKDDSQTIS